MAEKKKKKWIKKEEYKASADKKEDKKPLLQKPSVSSMQSKMYGKSK